MQATTPTYTEKIRSLPWSYLSNAANNVFAFLTVFGTVFIIFLDKLGLPKGQIGFILSLFPFCGLIALFAAPTIAKFGLKRTFVLMWGTRKVVTSFLLFTPWVLSKYGSGAGFAYVATVILMFAICRAIGETAFYPWMQEAIPDNIRGRFNSINATVGNIAALGSVGIAGMVIGKHAGLSAFMTLIAIGVVFGFISVWAATRIPGGAPVLSNPDRRNHFQGMMEAASDRNFRFFLAGLALLTFSTGVAGFIPLYLTHEVGISSSKVVMLSIAASLGALAGYLWGWASDRYGGKPVLLLCLGTSALFPILYMMIPRHSGYSILIAVVIMFGGGIFAAGVQTATQQIMYVNLVPPEKNTRYMALYYAWMGLIGGLSPIFAGYLLEHTKGITGRFAVFSIDSYTPLLLLSALANIGGLLLMHSIKVKGDISAGRLAGMFVRGNPLAAAESIVRHMLAKDEHARVSNTERMGVTGSPFPADELLESLSDPSFNVRYEAIISIARTNMDPKLTEALVGTMQYDDPCISTAAAWALGKIGDSSAIPALREILSTGFPLLKATSARSLATLGDTEAITLMAESFHKEQDVTLKTAYASALGTLQAKSETPHILELLVIVNVELERRELASSLARMMGSDRYFVRLLREVANEPGSALSQEVSVLTSRFKRLGWFDSSLLETSNRCVEALAQNNITLGAGLIADISVLTLNQISNPEQNLVVIIKECARQLQAVQPLRMEYVLLALQALDNIAISSKSVR